MKRDAHPEKILWVFSCQKMHQVPKKKQYLKQNNMQTAINSAELSLAYVLK